MAKPFNKLKTLEDLQPNVKKALDHIQICDDYTTPEATDAFKVMIKTTSLIILAYLVDDKENKILATRCTGTVDGCVNFLIFRLKAALHSRIHRAGGFSAAGILEGMLHLMCSDANKVNVMDQGALIVIVRMLQSRRYDDPLIDLYREQILAATAIWKLAFIDVNRNILKKDPDVIKVLKHRQQSRNAALREACTGALWEIYEGHINLKEGAAIQESSGPPDTAAEDKKPKGDSPLATSEPSTPTPTHPTTILTTTQPTTTVTTSVDCSPHVMISYQWDSQWLMVQLKDKLRDAGYNVWMDVEKMEGNILAAMANAVEKADVVIIAMSQKYKESNNCRTEASYAYKKKKLMVPLLVECDYDPDGWLGAVSGMLLYHKVCEEDTLDKELPLIIKELGHQGRINGSSQSAQSAVQPVPAIMSTKSKMASTVTHRNTQKTESSYNITCSVWTADQVREWLGRNGLDENLLPLFDGKCLAQMHKLSFRCPEYFHRALETNFNMDLLSVVKFTIALDELANQENI